MVDRKQNTYELMEKTIQVSRTSKTVPGGRNFSFRALVVVGDPTKNTVGFGIGKASEVAAAVEKATKEAKRSMVRIQLRKGTLQHTTFLKKGSTKIFMKPATEGTGIIAGGAMRAVFEVLGVQDVLAKVYGSTTPLNVVAATLEALQNMESPKVVARRRGLSITDLLGTEPKVQEA